MNSTRKRKSNFVSIIVISILGIIAFGVKKCKESGQSYQERTVTTATGDWRQHKIIFTSHARCRMECREISEDEVAHVLSSGTINEEKSREADSEAKGNCPTYALEGKTKDGQKVRIIVGACEKITKIITAIDLGKDHECNCR